MRFVNSKKTLIKTSIVIGSFLAITSLSLVAPWANHGVVNNALSLSTNSTIKSTKLQVHWAPNDVNENKKYFTSQIDGVVASKFITNYADIKDKGMVTTGQNASTGEVTVYFMFTYGNVGENSQKTYTGFRKSLAPTVYNVRWLSPSVDDKKQFADYNGFTNSYILQNWVNIDPKYYADYSNPTVTKTYDLVNGTISIKIDFKVNVTFNGTLTKSISTIFKGFKTTAPSPTTYNVKWLVPSADDKTHPADYNTFTDTYILQNWVEVDQKYYAKYANPEVKKSCNVSNGTIDLTINFKADVTFGGKLTRSISTTFYGFKTPTTIKYNVKWLSPSVDDKTHLADYNGFTDSYILQKWVDIDKSYYAIYPDPIVTRSYNLENGIINLTIDFKTNVIFKGNPTKTISTSFYGFQATSPTTYNVSWLSPSANDKVQSPNYSGFTDQYILRYWALIDLNYYAIYPDPKVTKKYDLAKGEINVTIDFVVNVLFNGKPTKSISTTFKGFKASGSNTGNDSSDVGAIIGGVVGSIGFILILALLIYYFKKRNNAFPSYVKKPRPKPKYKKVEQPRKPNKPSYSNSSKSYSSKFSATKTKTDYTPKSKNTKNIKVGHGRPYTGSNPSYRSSRKSISNVGRNKPPTTKYKSSVSSGYSHGPDRNKPTRDRSITSGKPSKYAKSIAKRNKKNKGRI